jgi:hypothetical protein
MKKNFIMVFVAVGLFATLISCSKEEQAVIKPVTISENPLDPDSNGVIFLPEGEIYYYKDSVTVYGQAGTKYLLLKPMSLEKYKNGELLDSICNKDIAIRFDTKGHKSHDKSVLWGDKPWVAEEFPPVITFRIGNTLTIKLSKMVTAFGFEYNTPFDGTKRAITTRYRNSKLNKVIPPTTTSYTGNLPTNRPPLGMPGGALLYAKESQTPFDEVRITFEDFKSGSPPLSGPFDISLAGFRYKVAK